MLIGARQYFSTNRQYPIGFSNTGVDPFSCFKCNLPSQYDLTGHTITFWGIAHGLTPSQNAREDCSTFLKIGDKTNGISLTSYHEQDISRLSLLEEGVAWTNYYGTTPSNFTHYAIVTNSISSVYVYVNGILGFWNISNTFNQPTGFLSICGCADPYYGQGEGRYLIRALNGTVAKVGIFDSIFNANDITKDMQLGPKISDRQDLEHLWIYSTNDEIGNWNLEIVGPAYLSNETPWS